LAGPVQLGEFIANALQRTIPDAQEQEHFNTLIKEIFGTVSLDRASHKIETEQLTITAAGTEQPEFSMPVQVGGQISIYHHIGIVRLDNPKGQTKWRVEVQYPQWTDRMRLEGHNMAGEAANVGIDMMRLGSSTTGDEPSLYGLPLEVFPGGILTIRKNGDMLIGERVLCRLLREIVPGPFSSEGANNLTGKFT